MKGLKRKMKTTKQNKANSADIHLSVVPAYAGAFSQAEDVLFG